MTLGQRIAHHRKALGISQETLGERLGVSRQAVSKWETGAAAPDMKNLIGLAQEFGISVSELTETAPPHEAPEKAASDTAKGPHSPWQSFLPVLCALGGATLVGMFFLLSGSGPEQEPPSSPPPDSPPAAEEVRPPAPYPATDFALLWTNADGYEEFLELGEQESLFPFDTTLELTEPEDVHDSGFPNDSYHDAVCGDLSLRYSHIENSPGQEVLRMLETSSPAFCTPRGVTVGSTEEDVLRTYGDDLIYSLSTIGPDAAIAYDAFYIYTPEGFSSLFFLLEGDIVAGIRMEDASYPYYHINNKDTFPVRNGMPDFSLRQETPKSPAQQVYDAFNDIVLHTDLTAEEFYHDRQTIFSLLSQLDWQEFGRLGATPHPDDTVAALLSWLLQQAPYTDSEIFCLQMGCQSNLDGWLTDSYAHVLSAALFSNPTAFVKSLAYNGVEECMVNAVMLAAYDAELYPVERDAAVSAIQAAAEAGSFTDAQAAWGKLLTDYLTTPMEEWESRPQSPSLP